MKKKFEMPDVNFISFESNDVICTSGCTTVCPEYGIGSITEGI